MKRLLVILLLVPLALALVLTLPGCFGPSAEQIMKDATKADNDLVTVHFIAESTQKLPRAPLSQGKVQPQNYVQKSEGDIDLKTQNSKVKTELVSGVMVTKLQVGDKQYWQLGGNWYDVPPSVQETQPATQFLSVSQYIKSFNSLTKLGDTNVQGEGCYHLRGEPDMKEFVKLPIITDLLKDPSGNQTRTVDDLAAAKIVLDFYVLKSNSFFKREDVTITIKANSDLIKQGYAEPGDNIGLAQMVTFSQFNEKIVFTAPANVNPFPGKT